MTIEGRSLDAAELPTGSSGEALKNGISGERLLERTSCSQPSQRWAMDGDADDGRQQVVF